MKNWTNQQEDAIKSTGRSVIVSAAAGSGKTAVLVERITRQLIDRQNPISADKIIIVTFTKDAAAELRRRLNSELQKKISSNPDDCFLLKQYTLFQNSVISTIDSFCFNLIRNNAEQLDITSGFSALDDTKDKVIQNKAIEDTMELWSKKYPDKYDILYDRFCTGNDENIKNIIKEMSLFLDSVPFREKWLDDTEKELKKENITDSVYYDMFLKYAQKNIRNALRLTQKNLYLIESHIRNIIDSSDLPVLYERLDEDTNAIRLCSKALENGIITNAEFQRTSGLKDGKNVCNKYGENRKEYKNLCQLKKQFECLKNDIKETADIFPVIHEILLDFYRILWEEKCKKNVISFSDGERLAIEMLSDTNENGIIIQSELAKELSEKYDIIMIDEYQDSNNKQDMIFKLLSKNFVPEGKKYGSNVFLVGDLKQSIYRFRLANPDNFKNTLEHDSKPYSENSKEKNVSVLLNKNFRSSPEVIDYVNYVFENLMSEKCGDVDYNKSNRLNFGDESEYPIPDPERKTEIIIISTPDNEPEDDDENENNIISEKNSVTAESECIAEKINLMLKNHYNVNTSDGSRPCEPRDFCILMRSAKTKSAYFVESLKRRGIDSRGEEESGYLKSREISILLDILRIIDNPLLDVPAVAVMMSPMFMFTSQDIAEIKAAGKDSHIYMNVRSICEDEYKVSEQIKNKCLDFSKDIQDFRMYSIIYSIGELIEKIYDTTDFLSIMQQFIDGEKKKANLRKLIQYAKSYEENASFDSAGGISGFLRYIETIQTGNFDLSQGKISLMSENFVSIKTIHKSKGLEYPFIFLAGTDSKFHSDNDNITVCGLYNTAGFKFYYPDTVRRVKTIPFEMINDYEKEKQKSEELRLLYVALTRAKQKIFITMNMNNKTISGIKNLSESFYLNNGNTKKSAVDVKGIGEWIWLTIIVHEKFREINEKFSLEIDNEPVFNNDYFKISYYSGYTEINQKQNDSVFPVNTEKLEKIRKITNFNYDISDSEIPSKMSVTQLISDENPSEEISLKEPSFMLEEKQSADGAERGTIIHKFLHFFDLSCNTENLDDEIQILIDKNHLTEAEAELLPHDKIKTFLNSELFMRMKNAVRIERERNFMIRASELKYRNDKKSDFLKSDGMVTGMIDLVIHEPDGLVIADYKSNKIYSEYSFKAKYAGQLEIYREAAEIIYGKPVKEVLIYSTELGKIIPV